MPFCFLTDVFPATNVFSMRDEFELVLSLSPFGDIVYATDNVKDLLGLYQVTSRYNMSTTPLFLALRRLVFATFHRLPVSVF